MTNSNDNQKNEDCFDGFLNHVERLKEAEKLIEKFYLNCQNVSFVNQPKEFFETYKDIQSFYGYDDSNKKEIIK